jgi:3-phosphoshikimate 1-carboxyvinyltransferase
MRAVVQPSGLSGTIHAPASKSAMQRACAAALVHQGTTTIRQPGTSNDDKAALDIIQQLGAQVRFEEDKVLVSSKGVQPVNDEIYCGESGLSIRMFTPIAALAPHPIRITGSGSLAKRPMHFFDEVLPQLGVAVKSEKGHIPLEVKGPLKPADITVDGSLSSQYLTGLLYAYTAADAGDVAIRVTNLASKPYVDLTLRILHAFGLKVPLHDAYQRFYFDGDTAVIARKQVDFTVEGDWSGGAFLLVAGALTGPVVVKGLDIFSAQADKAILQALQQSGAALSVTEESITVGPGTLKGFQFNAVDCPDLFPPLVSLAAFCEGTSVIEGVHRLAHKESSRAATLQQEFGKLGIAISFQNDLMLVQGGRQVKGGEVSSHNDHRIAMACAVAALRAENEVAITGADSVNKSYPGFWQHLQQLGASVSLSNI